MSLAGLFEGRRQLVACRVFYGHGTNAFIREGDRIFCTYFVDARGDEALGSTWSYLDSLGRAG